MGNFSTRLSLEVRVEGLFLHMSVEASVCSQVNVRLSMVSGFQHSDFTFLLKKKDERTD